MNAFNAARLTKVLSVNLPAIDLPATLRRPVTVSPVSSPVYLWRRKVTLRAYFIDTCTCIRGLRSYVHRLVTSSPRGHELFGRSIIYVKERVSLVPSHGVKILRLVAGIISSRTCIYRVCVRKGARKPADERFTNWCAREIGKAKFSNNRRRGRLIRMLSPADADRLSVSGK